jgi:hypothetical protein
MGDNGSSSDAVTQTSTGYFLIQMFMFISCIIMNIVIFNCILNIQTSIWIVSLTIILKYLINYGIKICQNVVYHLTGGTARCRAVRAVASRMDGGVGAACAPGRPGRRRRGCVRGRGGGAEATTSLTTCATRRRGCSGVVEVGTQ